MQEWENVVSDNFVYFWTLNVQNHVIKHVFEVLTVSSNYPVVRFQIFDRLGKKSCLLAVLTWCFNFSSMNDVKMCVFSRGLI